jgi:hypothetical protein
MDLEPRLGKVHALLAEIQTAHKDLLNFVEFPLHLYQHVTYEKISPAEVSITIPPRKPIPGKMTVITGA